MTRLRDLIGTECTLERLSGSLREFVEELRPTVVGAYHVMCSDETERECGEAFDRWIARPLLPDLKPARRAVFHTVNLGARYEWGAVRIAEEHFAAPTAAGALKLLVVKINAHVAVRHTSAGPEYGWLHRYGTPSACCGALAAMLEGSDLPAAQELAQLFSADGLDRVGILRDQSRVPIPQRALLAAVTNARLQAQRAVLDIQEHRPHCPAIFLVLPCVTINRPGPDTELLVGQYGIDWTEDSPEIKYSGLGDDPAAYRVVHEQGRAVVTDA
jgi:hypothetical protein